MHLPGLPSDARHVENWRPEEFASPRAGPCRLLSEVGQAFLAGGRARRHRGVTGKTLACVRGVDPRTQGVACTSPHFGYPDGVSQGLRAPILKRHRCCCEGSTVA